MKLKHILFACAILTMTLSSCTSTKKVTYLKNVDEIPLEVLSNAQTTAEPVLTVGDLLNINVSGANMNAMAPFNKGKYIDGEGNINSISSSSTSSGNYETSTDYYLVDNNGCIKFPIIGDVKVAGMTKSEVAEEISDAIYPKYVTEKPTVDIRLMNFRVVVGGAVKSPGVYQSKNERMTFIEAITMAGDLDIKGQRENILLYRLNPDGTREVHRLNIHDKDFVLSPYYYLQQNDYIYVEPNRSMKNSAWQLSPAVGATLTIVGGISSVTALVFSILNFTK